MHDPCLPLCEEVWDMQYIRLPSSYRTKQTLSRDVKQPTRSMWRGLRKTLWNCKSEKINNITYTNVSVWFTKYRKCATYSCHLARQCYLDIFHVWCKCMQFLSLAFFLSESFLLWQHISSQCVLNSPPISWLLHKMNMCYACLFLIDKFVF